jgi:predicted flap endonuclease-1-like 5' DNA nuclease
MNVAIALVLGLLIGWLVEWVIDWFYWRRPREDNPAPAPVLPASLPAPTQKTRYKSPPPDADDLKKIKGIGPVIAKRLNEAGIYTFAQLAELTLDEFEEALGDLLQRFINERAILRHARELADAKGRGELK